MRAALIITLGGLCALTSACASMETTPVNLAAAENVASSPQPLAGHDWFFDSDQGQAGLVYGLADSDDIWLTLTCRTGSGSLDLSQPATPSQPRVIALESGGDTETYRARVEPSEMYEDGILMASAKTADPVFQRFRRVGWLAHFGPDHRATMVPQPGSTDRIEAFFAFCG
ncbi:hypothetical protein [Brevundimonas sp.]|uniref:hypothetical protein n=1 Tax=Brevundimonas sp. TaxID=1871086 RepID=UPI002AB8889F|nr:hypothetical protein [Brevundimonas sp.]MDZ4363156.1 hypothetical protein [Brevundimonas sp.]